MWFKLWEVGVRGRLWRVLKSLYGRCEVAVRVGGVADDWYEEFVGLREGCVVSPLLFLIYINELPSLLEMGGGGGVRVGEGVVRCLMFADDVVLLSSTKEGLQRSLDIAGDFSRKWRFKFNFGRDKTAVMVFGGTGREESWTLTGRVVPIVQSYKYLGVKLVDRRKGKWGEQRRVMLAKARGAFWKAWGLGVAGGWLSVRAAKGLWVSLVQPILEYGAEVDCGHWEEAEVLLRLAGRMCLGVGREVPNEVVMGELGLWTVRARREYLMLTYWGKVSRQGGGTVVGAVYREGRRRLEAGIAGRGEWCVRVKGLLGSLGMEERWVKEDVRDEGSWRREVWKLVREKEGLRWREGIARKPSLGLYFSVKKELKEEWFLGLSQVWVRRWVRLRASASCLEVSAGRRRRVMRDRRVCGCGEGVEDEYHFLDMCARWREERRGVWEELMKWDEVAVRRVMAMDRYERVEWLLGGGYGAKTREMVLKKVVGWLYKREWAGRVVGPPPVRGVGGGQ